jgi:polar amino acid transport system substrate-binding protein
MHARKTRNIRQLLFIICLCWFKAPVLAADVIVVTELSPPYQTFVNDKVEGSASAKVRQLLDKAGLSAEFYIYPWSRAYQTALSKPNTLIYSIAKTPQRLALFNWLTPVASYKLAFVALEHRADIKFSNLTGLKRYSLSVQRNDIAHEWAIQRGLQEDEHFITCPDIVCSWQLLLHNNVDLIIEDPLLIESMLGLLQKQKGAAKVLQSIPELEFDGYLATNKDIDPAILAKLVAALKSN